MDTSDSEADLTLNSGARYFLNPDQFSGIDEAIENAIHMYQQKAAHTGNDKEKDKQEDDERL
jgi:predicted mannosyl-3-phosphoglycerate phosphatase (HAD superfamily)